MTACKNCGHQFELDYCNKCGQKASVKRIEMKWLLHELPHAVWHVEKGFMYNVVQLFKKPGYAVADYIDGKRKNFYHPVSYLLIILAVQFVVTGSFIIHWYDAMQDAGMNEWWAQWWKDYDSQQQIFLKHYIEFMIFWVPVAALIFWGFLHLLKRKYNYAESMVVTFFITAQSMIIQCFFLLVAAIAGRTTVTRLTDGTGMALSLLLTIYLVFQLGNSELSKTRKMFMAILCAFVQFAWTLIMLNIQTEFLHKTG